MTRARLVLVLVVASLALTGALAAQQGTTIGARADVALQAAIKVETIDGDLKGAIELYRKLADGADRAVAAQALVRMGQCYEKLGASQAAEARKAYERLVRDFADQKAVAEQARARLAALAPAAADPPSTAAALRRVYEGTGRFYPRITHDGRFAVFSQVPRSDSMLIVRDLVSGAERSIPSPEQPPDGKIAGGGLAPDGRRLAYAVVTNHQATADSIIKVVDPAGASPRALATLRDYITTELTWLRDGKRLLVAGVSAKAGADMSTLLGAGTGAAVWSADIYVEEKDLSPDGDYGLVVEEESGSQFVVIRDMRTGAKSRLTQPGFDVANAIWMPDGKAVMFLGSRGSTPGLWLVHVVDGAAQGVPQLVKPSVGDIMPLRMTESGTLYYWRSSQGSEWFMAQVDQATGKIAHPLTPFPGMKNSCGCDWSPDSSSIAYGIDVAKGRGDASVGCTVIAVRTLMDGRERIISPGLTNIRRVKWSPDARTFLVFGSRDGVAGIYGVTAGDGSATLLVRNLTNPLAGDNALFGTWAPDGNGFYYWIQDGRSQRLMYRELMTGATVERYANAGAPFLWFIVNSVSRNGDVAVAGTSGVGGTPVLVLPSGSGPPRTIYTGPPSNRIRWTAWAADGKDVWAIRRAPTREEPDRQELIRIPAAGGEPDYTGLAVPKALAAVFPSPDGTRLIVPTLPTDNEVWALDIVVPGVLPAKK